MILTSTTFSVDYFHEALPVTYLKKLSQKMRIFGQCCELHLKGWICMVFSLNFP